jgi:hypothetical protein
MKEKTVVMRVTVALTYDDSVSCDEVSFFEQDIAADLRVHHTRYCITGSITAKSGDVIIEPENSLHKSVDALKP